MTLKSLRKKDYSENPQTLGEHLKRRRRQLGLLQREVATQLGIGNDTYANWEKGKTTPVAAQFLPTIEFLGYDPTPIAQTLSERLYAKQRSLGVSLAQVARHLGWDPGSLSRYLSGTWALSPKRREALEALLIAEEVELGCLHVLKRRR